MVLASHVPLSLACHVGASTCVRGMEGSSFFPYGMDAVIGSQLASSAVLHRAAARRHTACVCRVRSNL